MSAEKPVRVTKKAAILAVYASGVTKPSEILAALHALGVETTVNSITVTLFQARKAAKAASEPTSSED